MAAVRRWNRKEVETIYKFLKEVDRKEWDRDPESVGKSLSSEVGDKELAKQIAANIKKLGAMGKLMARAAQACSLDEFDHAMETGDLPPLKLSNEEMEVIKGGCAPFVVPLVSMGISAIGRVAAGKAQSKAASQQYAAAKDQFNAQFDLQVAQGQVPNDPALRETFLRANGVGAAQNPAA